MDYLLCIPARETNTRENCEKIHNVLARMSDTYKLRIVPEPVKNKQFPCPPYYKKYRIYKPVKERDTNGEAYLEKEEEEMILSSCKTEEERELMKSCIYAYQYSAAIVLKSFREKEKKNKMQVRPLSERTQAAKGAGGSVRGGRPGIPEKAEKPEQERGAQGRSAISERPERAYRNRTAERTAEGSDERTTGREGARAARVSGAERAADRRSGNRALQEGEKKEERLASGKREKFERRASRRAERLEPERNEPVRDKVQEAEAPAQKAAAPEPEAVKADLKKAETVGVEASNPGTQNAESAGKKVELPKTEAQKPDLSRMESANPETKKHEVTGTEAPAPEPKATPIARSKEAPVQSELPFRAYAETGSLPTFRDAASAATVQPMQRKSAGYAPMERKAVLQPQKPDSQA